MDIIIYLHRYCREHKKIIAYCRKGNLFLAPVIRLPGKRTRKMFRSHSGMLYKYSLVFLAFLFFLAGFPGVSSGITISEEMEISREFMKMLRTHYDIISDPAVVSYLNAVGERILAVIPDKPFQYEFFVIDENTYNAFAIPGGKIFIYRGLFEAMETEDELAGILAHEISHVTSRHISKRIERSPKIGLVTLAGIAAGIFLGMSGAGAAGNALTIGSMAASQTASLAFSREDEMQADQISLGYLREAGYNGRGLLNILKKIRAREWYGTDQIPTYLRTHPAVEERIAYIDTQLETTGNKPEKSGTRPGNKDFRLARTRLMAKYGDAGRALRQFESDMESAPSDPALHYGLGIVYARMHEYDKALSHLRIALKQNAFDPYLLKDMGVVYFLSGKYEEAIKALGSAISILPENADALMYLGRAQLELSRFTEAEKTFLQVIRADADKNKAYYYLGETKGKQKELDLAHYYLGIYYHKIENLNTAQFHLKKAHELTKDPRRIKQIDEMLVEILKKKRKKRDVQIN